MMVPMVMQRRTFLKRTGSVVAAAAISPVALAKKQLTVGVVGGGIVGASIAMHLAQAGAKVTLFEKSAPAAGATSKSFAWINAYNSNPHYRALRLQSIAAWRELDESLPLDVHWGGCIHWAENLAEAETLQAEMDEFERTGYPASMLGAKRLAELEPNVRLRKVPAIAFNRLDAHIDPVHVTHEFLQEAGRFGATIVHPSEVTEIRIKGDGIRGVATTQGKVRLDRLVVAGGVDTPALAEQVGHSLKLKHAPGILLHTERTKPVLGRVLESSRMYVKQYRDGRIVGNDSSYAPDIPEHAGILHGPMEMPNEIRRLHGERTLDVVRDKLRGTKKAKYDRLTLGYRPMPADGLPVVGRSPGNSDVYIAVMHSGVTLAPIMGRYISHEIMSDKTVDELAPYRPGRN